MPVRVDEARCVRRDRTVGRAAGPDKQEGDKRRRQRHQARQARDDPASSCAFPRRCREGRHWRKRQIRHNFDRPDAISDPLEPLCSSRPILQTLDLAGEVNHPLAGEYLTRRRDRAQPCGEVERAAAVAAIGQRHGLTRIEADANSERQPGSIGALLAATALHLDGCAQRLASGGEDDECLIAAELDQIAGVFRNGTSYDLRERGGKRSRGLVPLLLRKARIPANVRDQERADDRDPAAWAGVSRIYALLTAAVDRFSLRRSAALFP